MRINTKIAYQVWLTLFPIPVLTATTIGIFSDARSSVEDKVVAVSFVLFFTTIATYHLRRLKLYIVDVTLKCLIVKSYFSKATTSFPFSYFDSVNSTTERRARGGPVRVLTFIKDGKVIIKLKGDYYRNLDKIESYLSPITITKTPSNRFWDRAVRWLYATDN